MRRARLGDEGAVRDIVRRHNRRLYRLARSIVNNDVEAEDILQNSYIRAFTRLGDFRGDSALSTWLCRIVINEALAALRSRRPTVDWTSMDHESFSTRLASTFVQANGVDPERAAAQHEIRHVLETAIEQLPQTFRTVFIARLVEGMTIEETAELLAVRPETVKTRLHRARAMLRRAIEERIGSVFSEAFPFAGERCARMAERVLDQLAQTR